MQKFAAILVVLSLGTSVHAMRAKPRGAAQDAQGRRLEVFLVDDANAPIVSERADYWAKRGANLLAIDKCPRKVGAQSLAELRSKSTEKANVPNPMKALATLLMVAGPNSVAAFSIPGVNPRSRGRAAMIPQMSIGLYYGTTTGNTETVAGYIADKAGIEDLKDIVDASEDEVMGHEGLIVGTPTWHTGADTERSGTSWDEWIYNTLPNMDLTGKKVAIFGVGDSSGYSDNYCDAAGELYECFKKQGATIVGMTPATQGFDYTESKSVVDDKFVGAVFDEDNYPDESEQRAADWVEQLKSEGLPL